MRRWAVEAVRGSVADLHGRRWREPTRRAVWRLEPVDGAVVVGSTQRDLGSLGTRAVAAGLGVVRRRSGGAAVLVEPGGMLWVDVVVPRGDPLWDDDVGRAPLWLGEVWVRALAQLGVRATVHAGPMVHGNWSRVACFAGLGPGEVSTSRPGAGARTNVKLVGMSQRRTREGARFQCAALRAVDAPRLAAILAGPDERTALEAELDARVTDLAAVGVAETRVDELWQALLAELPT